MSDKEDDPYAVSSDEDDVKGPPPKIEIEGRSTELEQIKESLVAKEETVKDENMLKEIEELRQIKAEELKELKADFESGKIATAEGVQKQQDDFTGLDKNTLSSFKDKFENMDATLDQNVKEKLQAGTDISEELSQIRSLKEKKADWESSVAEAQTEKRSQAAIVEELEAGKVKSNLEKFNSGSECEAVVDEDKLKELESLSSQVSGVKNRWKTGDVEKAEEREDASRLEELEELKRAGVKVKERFQPSTESEVQKSYDASELVGSGASDARKSFLEGSAFAGSSFAENTATKELEELKFTGLISFKDKFERGDVDNEQREKTQIEPLDIQLSNLKQAFEKPEAEMTVEERAEKKKREIEEEFLHYKLARQLRKQQHGEEAANGVGDEPNERDEAAFDVKSLMDKFKNIEDLAPKQIASKLDELEQLRVEASALRQRFEAGGDSSELSEEKKRQLDEEFAALKEERERAKKQFEEEQAAFAAENQTEKEEIQVAADHAQKMTAKWEKIHAKEAKKAEKSKMPQKDK